MSRLSIQVGRTIGWLTLGALVAILMPALLPHNAEATPPKSYLQPGMLNKNTCGGWHYSNSGRNTSLDYLYYSGQQNLSAGKAVYLYFTGSGTQTQPFKLFSISYCKGVEARIYQEGHVGDATYYKGEARFLHINVRSGVHGLAPTGNFTWLGSVHSGPEVSGCDWTGPHLHQDADVSSFTPFYTNWSGNHPWTYSHTICWSGSCP